MVLERVTDSHQPLLRHLQEVFAFLALTQVLFLSVGNFAISHLHTKHRLDSLHQYARKTITIFNQHVYSLLLPCQDSRCCIVSGFSPSLLSFSRVCPGLHVDVR